jgi:pimeloyl-ACP methyl ester carboxylesterase
MNIKVQNATIFVEDQGQGTPTLFLHGNPDSWILWRGIMGEMKSRFRCLAPDLPGFGHSEVPSGFGCSLPEMAEFIDQLVSAAGVSKPLNLVVHDFGGPYGLAWAVKFPEKVRRIAVFNTNFFSDYRWHSWARIWRTPVLGELSMAAMNWRAFHSMMHKNAPGLSEEHIKETYATITPGMKKMVLQLYRATNPQNYRGWEDQYLALAKRVPVCVLWGDRDPYISPAYAKRFAAQKIWHFPDYGHWLPAEAPKETAACIAEFFV